MDNTKVLIDNVEQDVFGIFYIYNSKYYYMYTLKEKDGEDYIKLYLVQVGKETASSALGPVDTGNMIGVEISDPNEWKSVQGSITSIVAGKKNNTNPEGVQVLPITMLTNLKITSHNNFKLLKSIMTDNFGLVIEDTPAELVQPEVPAVEPVVPVEPEVPTQGVVPTLPEPTVPTDDDSDVIVDYRTRFFEEQEKNKASERRFAAPILSS